MDSNENMQKYIDEIMRFYQKSNPNPQQNIPAPPQPIPTPENAPAPNQRPMQPEPIPRPTPTPEPMPVPRPMPSPTPPPNQPQIPTPQMPAPPRPMLTPVELIDRIPAEDLQFIADSIAQIPTNDMSIPYSTYGFLQVVVSSGDKAFPISDAVVVIMQKTPSGEVAVNISATDANGKTPIIRLPAPDASDENGANTPFATYKTEVFSRGNYTVINDNVPIFSNTTSILPVNMIPLPTSASNRREMTFYSDEPIF